MTKKRKKERKPNEQIVDVIVYFSEDKVYWSRFMVDLNKIGIVGKFILETYLIISITLKLMLQ